MIVLIVAIPCFGLGGLDDYLSLRLEAANCMTIVDVVDNVIRGVVVFRLPPFNHGNIESVLVNVLLATEVDVIMTCDVSEELKRRIEERGIKIIIVEKGLTVEEALKTLTSA
ncbi:MAG: hypothetical protein DRJ60_00800 [Thermoprotei archaeon]|nr:MAG: hypothetical protein DRJ60_00800 [Thermoprotei archaeon]